jgi:aminoglycoside 6'-N-acetyltransferase
MAVRTPQLHGPRVRLRRVAAGDRDALVRIREDPSVRRWWGAVRDDDFELPHDGDLLAIEVGGVVAGAIQYDEEPDPQYRSAGIDVFLGPAWQGRGLGREAVALLARWLLGERGHHRLTIDPAAANEAAIRCYAAVGFRPVGVLRRYERAEDGEWRDGLLMDLLAGELREPEPPEPGPGDSGAAR